MLPSSRLNKDPQGGDALIFTPRRIIGWVTLIALLAGLWLYALPPQLGGRTTFLTTHGISMQPLLHDGDLAVLQTQSNYRVGDIVEYHSDALNTEILHRIVSIDNGLISTKGDNNNFVDLDHPTTKQVHGKMIHRFKGGGKYIKWLKSLPARAIGCALIGWAIFSAIRGQDEKKQNRSSHATKPKRSNLHLEALKTKERSFPWLVGAQVIAAAFITFSLLVAGIAFSKPIADTQSKQMFYSTNGVFAYSANASGGDLVYRDGQVSTGDPIYLSMVHNIFVTFDYSLSMPGHYKGGGTISLQAVIKGTSGWSHPFPLSDVMQFSGNDVRISSLVQASQIQNLVSQIDQFTAVKDSSYTIVIQPTVHLSGSIGGAKLDNTFAPTLMFNANQTQWKLQSADSAASTAGPQGTNATPSVTNGVHVQQTQTITIPPAPVASLRALGFSLGIATLRVLGLIGAGIGALTSAAIFVERRRRRLEAMDMADKIVATHRDLFMPVTDITNLPQSQVVDVASLDALARVAEQHEVPILHKEGDLSLFIFHFAGFTYRYVRPVQTAEERFVTEVEPQPEGVRP